VRRSLEEKIYFSLCICTLLSLSLSLSRSGETTTTDKNIKKRIERFILLVQRENLPFLWAAAPPFFEAKMTGQLFFLLDLLKKEKRLFDSPHL